MPLAGWLARCWPPPMRRSQSAQSSSRQIAACTSETRLTRSRTRMPVRRGPRRASFCPHSPDSPGDDSCGQFSRPSRATASAISSQTPQRAVTILHPDGRTRRHNASHRKLKMKPKLIVKPVVTTPHPQRGHCKGCARNRPWQATVCHNASPPARPLQVIVGPRIVRLRNVTTPHPQRGHCKPHGTRTLGPIGNVTTPHPQCGHCKFQKVQKPFVTFRSQRSNHVRFLHHVTTPDNGNPARQPIMRSRKW